MSKPDAADAWSRRSFLKHGASLAAAPLALRLSACVSSRDVDTSQGQGSNAIGKAARKAASAEPIDGETLPEGAVLVGLLADKTQASVTAQLDRLDFSWLAEGDSVLIKVASNSGNPHPATTSPLGVRAMVSALEQRGAARVIVADQAGVEHVRRSEKGRYSNTRERFRSNGLAALEDVAELHYFDDGDWEAGYIEATLPEGHHWPRGMRVAAIVQEIDHILYMPRISAHMLAGITTAQKCAIGWLRDDSRHDLHNDAQSFYEKYAEISYTEEIRSRLRMVVTLNEQIQLFGGPDDGTVYTMDPALLLASTSLANHDAVATSLLAALQKSTGARPAGMVYSGALAPTLNGLFASGAGVGTGDAGGWVSESPSSRFAAHAFEDSVDGERAVQRGWELSGGRPDSVQVVVDADPLDLDETLRADLDAHAQGLYDWTRFG